MASRTPSIFPNVCVDAKSNPSRATGARTMAKKLKAGDRVTWNTSQGKTSGTVQKKLTSASHIKGHHVAASPDNPEYLVKSEKTGKPAAHKADALKKQK